MGAPVIKIALNNIKNQYSKIYYASYIPGSTALFGALMAPAGILPPLSTFIVKNITNKHFKNTFYEIIDLIKKYVDAEINEVQLKQQLFDVIQTYFDNKGTQVPEDLKKILEMKGGSKKRRKRIKRIKRTKRKSRKTKRKSRKTNKRKSRK